MGGFFSLMSATFAYEDPLSRASREIVGTKAQTVYVMKEMGRNMWSTGKGFAKVGALYSGFECCIEGVSLLVRFLGGGSSGAVSRKERHYQCGCWRVLGGCDVGPSFGSHGHGRWRSCICGILGRDRLVPSVTAERVSHCGTYRG